MKKILTLNMGSTSSKFAVFEDDKQLFSRTLRHTQEELDPFDDPSEQFEWRRDLVLAALAEEGFPLNEFDAVCSRAGALTRMVSGTYNINDEALDQASDPRKSGTAPHPLGIRIADAISKEVGIPAFFCDPVTTDELCDVARISGFAPIARRSAFHALNQKAVARKTAKAIGKPYNELNLVGLHLGGGTSCVAHCKGMCIDICDCASEGAFSMDRPGTLSAADVIKWAYKNYDNAADAIKVVRRKGGIFSYLGITDFLEVCNRSRAGDAEAKLLYDAFVFQQCKDVGQMAAVMKFDVDAIFITGGIAFDAQIVEDIKDYVGKIAPVYVFPGEEEMQALAEAALRVLNGEEEAKEYVR